VTVDSGFMFTKDGLPDFLKAIKALTNDRVLVGIAAEKAFREPTEDDPHPEINNAEIGYVNEFGAPEINLPARPHLVPGIKKVVPDISETYKKAAQYALDGNYAKVAQAHGVVGTKATSSVKNLITSIIPPPLSKRTLKDREARGRTGTTPLIDTGQYRNNINYVIKPASEEDK